MIKVEHLTKKYGEVLALDDLSFEIEEGQVYGFLGPNGAGKSTTMNIMTGCLSATAGSDWRAFAHDDVSLDAARQALAGVKTLAEVLPLVGTDGFTHLRLRASQEDLYATTREVFFAFAERRLAILELRLNKASLEDVFLELTDTDTETEVTDDAGDL